VYRADPKKEGRCRTAIGKRINLTYFDSVREKQTGVLGEANQGPTIKDHLKPDLKGFCARGVSVVG